jgi:hypothetical protein
VARSWDDTFAERGEDVLHRAATARLTALRRGAPASRAARGAEPHPGLATRSTLERLIERRAAAGEGPERAASGRLVAFVVGLLERQAEALPQARLDHAWAGGAVEAAGRRVALADLAAEIAETADTELREALERARESAWGELAPLRAEALGRGRDALLEASGADDVVTWRLGLAGHDAAALGEHAAAFLTATDDLRREATRWLLRGRVDLGSRPARAHDLAHAARARDHDSVLAPGEAWRLGAALAAWGLEATTAGRLVREAPAVATTRPVACAVAVRVPEEVVLFAPPPRGLPAWRATLRATGRALVAAQRPAGASFASRRLPDGAFAATVAALFERLTCDPLWARKALRAAPHDAERLARTAAAACLLDVRRDAARVLHELALHRERPDAEEVYLDSLRRADGVAPSRAGRLHDVSPAFACADHLCAAVAEAAARAELRERFDEDWFMNPRAAGLLGRLLAAEPAPSLDDLTRRALEVVPSTATLVASLEARFA